MTLIAAGLFVNAVWAMADINLHEEAESHEDSEGDAEFDAAIEDWLNGAGGDMLEQVPSTGQFSRQHPNTPCQLCYNS
jgi:hypothetical protein